MSVYKLAATLDLDVNNADQLSTARDELQYIKDNQDAQIDMTVKLDESQFKQLLGDGENASIDVTANNEEAKEKIDEAKNYAESQKPQMKIDGNNDPAINKGTSATQMINSMTGIIKVNADTSGMASHLHSLHLHIHILMPVLHLPEALQLLRLNWILLQQVLLHNQFILQVESQLHVLIH